ncbi:MAG: radical SAM protein [Verrucomicrobiia bacterium]
MPISLKAESLLKTTMGRCPICHNSCPAEIWRVEGKPAQVFIRRACSEHGLTENLLSSDARFYWLAQGDCQTSGCCSADGSNRATLGRNASGKKDNLFETLSTCLALIEIVDSCNLTCPTCYANSPFSTDSNLKYLSLCDIQNRIESVIQKKGKIEILQLSGGEPTLHPHFFELLQWLQNHPQIDYTLLNTNGVRLASDSAFAQKLAEHFHYGKFQIYLQFDGIQNEGQISLRGMDLRSLRQQTIEFCETNRIPLTLAMTVTHENLSQLWSTVQFALPYTMIRGVTFQPFFSSGRAPKNWKASNPRLNTADIILALIVQSSHRLTADDFTPPPCGDPNCATIGYLLKTPEGFRSISEFINFSDVQGFLHDKIRYNLQDLTQCGCETEPLGELLKKLELDETHTFRLFIKPFMDAWTWDEHRIDRCCTHVIRPDGKLDSFCRYYSNFSDTQSAP